MSQPPNEDQPLTLLMKGGLIQWLLVSGIVSQFSNYQCDPNTCKLPACKCATIDPPIQNPPQFILVTFDDAINKDVIGPARAVFANRKNPNGCSAKATFFAQALYSNPVLAQQWYSQGNEIADHSFTHVSPFAGSKQEIEGMRAWATAFAGIPRGQVKGVRFPFRNYTKEAVEMLASLGFEYDSSMAAQSADRIWPYTLDNGVVTECMGPNPLCGAGVVAKGLWEIPMYTISGEGGVHLMDPYNDPSIQAPLSPDSVTKLYLDNFNEHYRGNRAPFGVYGHPVWLGPANQAIPDGSQKLAAVNRFLDQAQSNPDVWIITNAQLIQYMKNPVPASEIGKQSYMLCNKQAPTDICNGLTDVGVETCPVFASTFQTCYGCPSSEPTVGNPTPPKSTSRCPAPSDCDTTFWDPVKCECRCRDSSCDFKDVSTPSSNDPSSPGGKSSSTSNVISMTLLFIAWFALFLWQ